jgi:hypothetical protein
MKLLSLFQYAVQFVGRKTLKPKRTEEDYEREHRERLKAIEQAVWDGDTDALYEVGRCDCCCDEHTSSGCYARIWGGCRGQDTLSYAEIAKWEEHYAKTRGMTRDEFYGY